MACWSVENATKAYLKTMKMGKNAKEPDAAEFISALAAGNNAQFMVVACASGSTAGCSTTLALVAAAYQTGGRVVCILPRLEELHLSKQPLGNNASHVEFVTGDAQSLLFHDYRQADFVVIDCNIENHEAIIRAMQASGKHDHGTIVLGYNAFCKGSWQRSGSNTRLLPIGEGLLLTRIAAAKAERANSGGFGQRSHWVVEVDKCTGEEHVFRVRSSQGRFVQA